MPLEKRKEREERQSAITRTKRAASQDRTPMLHAPQRPSLQGRHASGTPRTETRLHSYLPKTPRSMAAPVPRQAEQARYAQEYEAKQRAYEDALKQAEHYAASKGTM